MNKEIKFRVWNGFQMEYDVIVGKFGAFYVNPGSKGDGLDEKDRASLTPFNTKYENAPVMQYTGLKDKNGKEIYEGDVVRMNGRMVSDTRIEKGRGKKENLIWNTQWGRFDFEIKWDEANARFEFYNRLGARVGEFHTSMPEVIGNIYENENLLNP